MEDNMNDLTQNSDDGNSINIKNDTNKEPVTTEAISSDICNENHQDFQEQNKKTRSKINKKILSVSIIAVLLAAGIIGGAGAWSSSYLKPIHHYYSAIENIDISEMNKAYGETYSSIRKEIFGENSKFSYDDTLYSLIKNEHNSLEERYGRNIKIDYKLKQKKEISKSDLKYIKDGWNDYGNQQLNISEGYRIKAEITYKGYSYKKGIKKEKEIFVLKINGKWAMITDNNNSLI